LFFDKRLTGPKYCLQVFQAGEGIADKKEKLRPKPLSSKPKKLIKKTTTIFVARESNVFAEPKNYIYRRVFRYGFKYRTLARASDTYENTIRLKYVSKIEITTTNFVGEFQKRWAL